MRWYKVHSRILLMLFVVDFALAAPVVVQHEARVSVGGAAKDVTAMSPLRRDPSDKWLANAADRTNAPSTPTSSDSGHRREQQPRQQPQHDPALPIARPPLDLNAGPLNPPSPHDDSRASNPASLSGSASGSPVSELMPTTTRIDPPSPPDGSPPIAPSRSMSFGSWMPTDSGTHSSLTNSWPPPDEPHSFSFKPSMPTDSDTHSGWTNSWPPPDESHSSSFESSMPTGSGTHSGLASSWPPPSEPGPSTVTEPDPTLGAKRPRPEEHDSESSLSKMFKLFKGKFKRRFSGSGVLNAARDLQGNL